MLAENSGYINPVFTQAINNMTGIQENTVKAQFNQDYGAYQTLEEQAWLPNYPGMGTWYQQKNAEAWTVYITVLYQMVNQMLGFVLQD